MSGSSTHSIRMHAVAAKNSQFSIADPLHLVLTPPSPELARTLARFCGSFASLLIHSTPYPENSSAIFNFIFLAASMSALPPALSPFFCFAMRCGVAGDRLIEISHF
jgi:hypothetical protein